MKNKSYILLLVFYITGYLTINAQTNDFYYTTNNNKINITKISDKYLAEFPNGLGVNNTMNPTNYPGIKLSDKTYLVVDTLNLDNYNAPYFLTPTYITAGGQEINYTKDILLKFKEVATSLDKSNVITSNNLILIKETLSYDMYRTTGDALQVSKNIYLSGQVEFSTPDFIAEVQKLDYIPNDPYFNQQWYLHNTGQGTNDGKSTTIDADIDAPEAWSITKGSPNITVAIIDEGVTSNHPDLPNTRQVRLNGSNFAAPYQGVNNPNDPSPTISTTAGNNHGNACAGIVAATQDNNEGVTGIAPLCKIMPIKIPFGGVAPSSVYADAINFANLNGADIISNSWGYNSSDSNLFPAIVSAINNAVNNNKQVVFAAGNTANRVGGNNGFVSFPGSANIPNLITVGASDRNNTTANYSPNGSNLEISAPSHSGYNTQIAGESFNIWTIDIPGANNGYNSWRDNAGGLPLVGEVLPNNGVNFASYTGRMGGTSASTPEVAGVLALMKSVNSCLSVTQIKNILQSTADKIGGFNYNWNSLMPGHSIQLGYGKVNAHKAVQMAQLLNSPTLDLMVKDGIDDNGTQPNNITPYMWASTDIWIRNQADGLLDHQNPEYSATIPNYAYVRITNKSCVASTGNEQLKFYWAKAGTSLSWPSTWNGLSTFPNGSLQGAPASPNPSTTIPTLQPGQEIILQIPFLVPDPTNYAFAGSDQWHFCLLARIEAANDPLNETSDLYSNVKNNNGIAWKNVTIVDLVANRTSGTIAVGNPFDEPHNFYLELVKEDLETGNPIYVEAEVTIKMDEILFNAWERGGKEAQQIDVTSDEKKKIVRGNNVIIDNIAFNANEIGIMNVNFNFLTQELTEKTRFAYHVIQKDAETGQIIGGETFIINKNPRTIFEAEAPDKEVDLNQAITISAEDINEPAIYNWYDNTGNLIYQGKDLQIANAISEKFKLEVISTVDGFKDYTEVEVKLKPSTLENIMPNPATNNVLVSYKLNGVNSAYLMIIGYYGNNGTSNNYILDLTSSETNINVSNYPSGFYTVALVVNGEIVDAKTLIKQ